MNYRRPFGLCILTETFWPVTGGGESQARTLVEELIAREVNVTLITRRSDRSFAKYQSFGGAKICRVGPAGRGPLRKWAMVVPSLAALFRLRRDYDVILVCGFRVLGLPALVAQLVLKRPCVLKADSQGELSGRFFDAGLERFGLRHDRFPAGFLIRLRNALLRKAVRFVAISSVIESEYAAENVAEERIVRIPNSVDTARFRPVSILEKHALRSRFGFGENRPIAVFTGRLVTTKGLSSLLLAWQSVLATCPDALLILVGSGGLGLQNCEDKLRRYVRENGLESSVRFTGSVDNVHQYLQLSDVFIFPTEREAFGISIIEAMACGVPVVTTRVDGVRDIADPERNALVVAPGDEEALAAAILRAIAGGAAIEAMAGKGREEAVRRYSSEHVVASYRDLLAAVIEE